MIKFVCDAAFYILFFCFLAFHTKLMLEDDVSMNQFWTYLMIGVVLILTIIKRYK